VVVRWACLILVLSLGAGAAASELPPERSKKERLLLEKSARKSVRAENARALPVAARPLVTLRNVWTLEVLPIDAEAPPSPTVVNAFLRDHYTNQAASMDPRLLPLVLRAAARFKSRVIEVVSAYRAPKYQLLLRKKGHEVARDSQHPLGHAVDFRLPGLATRVLYQFVRGLRAGGAGYYPESAFVHADVGRVRTWRGH
jgi:hypothetical protein